MERDQQTIGIDAITYSIPKAYVALPDLAAARSTAMDGTAVRTASA